MRNRLIILAMFLTMNSIVVVPAAVALQGCAGNSDAVRTELLRDYRAEARRCEDSIAAIIARDGTTEQEDLADLDAEQARCSNSLARIRERMENH